MAQRFLTSEDLRSFVLSEIERRGWSKAFAAERAGIHRNVFYAALSADNPASRAGTLETVARGLGYEIERAHLVKGSYQDPTRVRLHDD
jgi:lambda repressor-like predicted transcriptional regulator